MARPQQFDREEVLDQALLVFWKQGFEAASIQDLVDATGLNRGSLYNSFGDKDELFTLVMERYRATAPTKPLVIAANDPEDTANTRVLISTFFDALVERAQNDGDYKGCLLTNTAAGFYGCSDAMADWVRETLQGLEQTLTTLVKRGQVRGDIASEAKASAIARSMVASAQGLNVLARTGASTQMLKDIAAMSVRIMDR